MKQCSIRGGINNLPFSINSIMLTLLSLSQVALSVLPHSILPSGFLFHFIKAALFTSVLSTAD
jgi:hypothetical protein